MPLSLQEVFAKAGKEELALVQDGNIYYVVLNTKVNVMTPHFIQKMHEFLDVLEKVEGDAVMVSIGSGPKTFSGGFQLTRWMESECHVVEDLQNV